MGARRRREDARAPALGAAAIFLLSHCNQFILNLVIATSILLPYEKCVFSTKKPPVWIRSESFLIMLLHHKAARIQCCHWSNSPSCYHSWKEKDVCVCVCWCISYVCLATSLSSPRCSEHLLKSCSPLIKSPFRTNAWFSLSSHQQRAASTLSVWPAEELSSHSR